MRYKVPQQTGFQIGFPDFLTQFDEEIPDSGTGMNEISEISLVKMRFALFVMGQGRGIEEEVHGVEVKDIQSFLIQIGQIPDGE